MSPAARIAIAFLGVICSWAVVAVILPGGTP